MAAAAPMATDEDAQSEMLRELASLRTAKAQAEAERDEAVAAARRAGDASAPARDQKTMGDNDIRRLEEELAGLQRSYAEAASTGKAETCDPLRVRKLAELTERLVEAKR